MDRRYDGFILFFVAAGFCECHFCPDGLLNITYACLSCNRGWRNKLCMHVITWIWLTVAMQNYVVRCQMIIFSVVLILFSSTGGNNASEILIVLSATTTIASSRIYQPVSATGQGLASSLISGRFSSCSASTASTCSRLPHQAALSATP